MPYKIAKKGAKHCVQKEDGKQIACHDTRADALKQMKALYANEKADLAHDDPNYGLYQCFDEACERTFLDFERMVDHAEAVHTFDDIRRMVHEAVREEYGSKGVANSNTWVWIDDLADDWVVFMVEKSGDSQLLKASYSITDGAVTLGEPVEVRRRTVYEAVKKAD